MTKKISSAQAKSHFSALVAEVAYGNSHIIIERRGRPLVALVSVSDLERLDQGVASSARPLGALALVGAWREVDDDVLEGIVAQILAGREDDKGRL